MGNLLPPGYPKKTQTNHPFFDHLYTSEGVTENVLLDEFIVSAEKVGEPIFSALNLVRQGFRVFPCHGIENGVCTCDNPNCKSPGKHPVASLCPNGCKDATAGENQIRAWFGAFGMPQANIGIATGKDSNLIVIDVDEAKGGDVCDLYRFVSADLLEQTRKVKTGGGFHYYFSSPPDAIIKNSTSKLGEFIDVRGEGGYVIAPNSLHFSGNRYEFLNTKTLIPFPKNIVDFLNQNHSASIAAGSDRFPEVFKVPDKILYGTQHDTLFRLGCSLRSKGCTFEEIESVLQIANLKRCEKPGLPADITKLAKSIVNQYQPGSTEVVAYFGAQPSDDLSTTKDNSNNAPDPEKWEDPKTLDIVLKPVEKIDDDCLPEVLVNWLRPAAKVIGCPFDFLALSAIVTAGMLIGARLRLKPLEHSDWFVVPNLYAGIVGLPSTKKTPALDETRKPILEIQAEARKTYENLKRDYDIEIKFYESDSAKVLKKAASISAYKTQLALLNKPEKPLLKRLETNDITSSKLIQFLSENPNGLMLFRDELAGWLKSLEADYEQNARPFYLELWKGAISYSLDRVDGREIPLTSGTLSILGGVQPSKLQRFVTEAYSFENSDGFLQRFLWSYPDPIGRAQKPTASDYDSLKNGFAKANQAYKKLSSFDFQGRTITSSGESCHVIKFAKDAQQTVDAWRDQIETEAEQLESEDEAFSAFLYKLPKNCFAIALIFHCLENIERSIFPDEISNTTVLKAINYAEVLVSHARRVFALGENRIFALARTLLEKIRKGTLKQSFNARDISRKGWSGLKGDVIPEVLSLLVDYGYLKENNTNRTKFYYFHPSLELEVVDENELED